VRSPPPELALVSAVLTSLVGPAEFSPVVAALASPEPSDASLPSPPPQASGWYNS
jgi:hypothetical protein